MYSEILSVQILISLMKEFGVKNVVLSPGGSDIPLIHSIETDDYFTCYSVVDERSAAYFAMGVAQEKNQICACVCTSGTSVCNYLPGITEAWYQSVPVLAITADKNPYFQSQLETQKINQNNIFAGVVKKSVNLPLINSEDDVWLCNRLVNEALISLTHHGFGPAHINIPIVGRTDVYSCSVLPKQRVISVPPIIKIDWKQKANYLLNKKIMVVVGQNIRLNTDELEYFKLFFDAYNCFFATEHLSNLNIQGTINTYPLTETHTTKSLEKLKPDLVISIGNNLASYQLKPFLRYNFSSIENWLIWESGEIRDAYKCLTTVFECSAIDFFKRITSCVDTSKKPDHSYYHMWEEAVNSVEYPEFSFSNFFVAKKLVKHIPDGSILHTAILNSTRIMQYFELNNNVRCYSNVGALGIDGCFSTFAGQAASTESLAFLVIGDLSFFYDMNAAGLRSIGNNVRVVMLNNGGGSEFHFFMGKDRIPTINSYICAEHDKVAAGWIKSLNYDYYFASTPEELDVALEKFDKPSDKPIFLEILTNMEEDAHKTRSFYDRYRNQGSTNKKGMSQAIKAMLSEKQVSKVKRIMKILKEK